MQPARLLHAGFSHPWRYPWRAPARLLQHGVPWCKPSLGTRGLEKQSLLGWVSVLPGAKDDEAAPRGVQTVTLHLRLLKKKTGLRLVLPSRGPGPSLLPAFSGLGGRVRGSGASRWKKLAGLEADRPADCSWDLISKAILAFGCPADLAGPSESPVRDAGDAAPPREGRSEPCTGIPSHAAPGLCPAHVAAGTPANGSAGPFGEEKSRCLLLFFPRDAFKDV